MKKPAAKNRLNPGGSYWIWYALPAIFFYVLFMAFPLLDSIRMSLYTGTTNNFTFVGLDNFTRLFTDPDLFARYWGSMKNTVVFFIVHMLVQNVLGIVFAVLITQKNMKGSKLYQTIIFIPTTFAVLVTGYLWKLLLNPVWSKNALASIGLEALAKPWLGNEKYALLFVAFVSCWQWIGIPTMMFAAALQNISDDIYEAADIAGANKWQVFWHIKLPLIKPTVGIVTILTFVNNFNAFDIVFAMENVNGAPGYATDLLGTFFYRIGIAGQHPIGIPDPGMGAAIASITFVILMVGSLFVMKLTEAKE